MAKVRKGYLIAGAIALGLAIVFRRDIASTGGFIVDAAKTQAFNAVIPPRTRAYTNEILRVAKEEDVSPFLIVAIMERETLSGTSKYLDKPGPAGRGDGGHGHGLMQIDDRSFGDWLRTMPWWDPYTNIKKGVQVFKAKRAYIQKNTPRPLSETELFQASIAAYNTGEGNVVKSLKLGRSVDTTTAGANYSTDVYAKLSSMEAAFRKPVG